MYSSECVLYVGKSNVALLHFVVQQDPRIVQLLSHPHLGNTVLNAGPAQFGYDLKVSEGVSGL